MKVSRDGDDYEVLDLGDEWQFWQERFTGDWGAQIRSVIDELVDGGTYVDLGAWVGPTVLWAARKARRVIAVEPDPEAYRHLQFNVAANVLTNVTTMRVAVGRPGPGLIRTRGRFGDSLSSTVRGVNGQGVDVLSLEAIIDGAPDVQLIKCDIEGAEGEFIPREIDYLRELGAPLLLAIHPDLWLTNPLPFLEDWAHETVTQVDHLFTP